MYQTATKYDNPKNVTNTSATPTYNRKELSLTFTMSAALYPETIIMMFSVSDYDTFLLHLSFISYGGIDRTPYARHMLVLNIISVNKPNQHQQAN